LTHTESIRDVIAFPKNQNAVDLMFNSPATVTQAQIDELHICVKDE
jgi:aspartyl-tRNA synthetase